MRGRERRDIYTKSEMDRERERERKRERERERERELLTETLTLIPTTPSLILQHLQSPIASVE